MASEDWLDPEFGTSGLSGFDSGRKAKLAASPGLASGLDMLEMTKDLVSEMYESKRPDDGVNGNLFGTVVHFEERSLDSIKDPIIDELYKLTDDIGKIEDVLVVYVAPGGGSCSMLPRPKSADDKASIYRFPRFYSLTSETSGPIIGRPCEVSYLDLDTLSFGLFHGMLDSSPQPQQEDFLYRKGADRQEARNAFNSGNRSKLVKNMTLFDRAIDTAGLIGKSYHESVLDTRKRPFGESGGGRIKNNVELNKKRDGVTLAKSYSFAGKARTLEKNTYRAYVAMVRQATKDGISSPLLQIRSAYRSVSRQKRIWEKALRDPKNIKGAEELGIPLKSYARKYVAPPGRSRHHSGRAIDLNLGYPISKSYISKMKATDAFAWLLENAEFYGFYNYKAEPWHWEFNPDSRLTRLSDKERLAQKESLEESLEKLSQREKLPDTSVPRKKVYKPYAAETYALFEEAAFIAGVDPAWARSDALHKILQLESGGRVGIPNYTFGRGNAGKLFGTDIKNRPENWSKVHDEIKKGFYRDERGKRKYVGQVGVSSATGLGQLTGASAEIFYPSGIQGIGDPLEEAVGMLRYIAQRRGSPEEALKFGMNDGFNKGRQKGEWSGY